MEVSGALDWIVSPTSASAFWNAFWVFLGIVVGAFIQYLLGLLNVLAARRTALRVLQTEVQMNLSEAENFRVRLAYLRERISAQQISEDEIFVGMREFDYSALNPLMASGYFHSSLGPDRARAYLEFLRFFNNNSADVVNSMLRTEHERGKSLDYVDWLERKSHQLEQGLASIGTK
jgi:hypothetical protein